MRIILLQGIPLSGGRFNLIFFNCQKINLVYVIIDVMYDFLTECNPFLGAGLCSAYFLHGKQCVNVFSVLF